MSNGIDTLINTIKNGIIGLWNTSNIYVRLGFSPFILFLFVIILLLWTLKLGLILLRLLFDEVNFYWAKWAEASSIIIKLIDEFSDKIIFPIIKFLIVRLYDTNYSFDKTSNKLSENWFLRLLKYFALHFFYLISSLLLILFTFSLLIYTLSVERIHMLVSVILRLLIFTPIVHRFIRYKFFLKKPFSWQPENTKSNFDFFSSWKPLVTLLIIFIVLIITIFIIDKL